MIRLSELSERYLQHQSAFRSEGHIQNLREQLRRVIASIGDRPIDEVRPPLIHEHVARRRTERRPVWRPAPSNRTLNMETGALRHALGWAVKMELIAVNPLQAWQPLPYRRWEWRKDRRAMSGAEREALLAAVGRMDQKRVVPQLPMYRTFLEAGLRWNEVATLQWRDIDWDARAIQIRAEVEKSRRGRMVPISKELVAVLCALRDTQRAKVGIPTNLVFLSPTGRRLSRDSCVALRTLYRTLDLAGIRRKNGSGSIDIHALRDDAATQLAIRGVPLTATAKFLGHADPRVTAKHYIKHQLADLRKSIFPDDP